MEINEKPETDTETNETELSDLNDQVLDEAPADRKEKEEEKPSGAVSLLYDTVSVFTSALIIIAVIFTFVVRFVGVSGRSMQPTLAHGDWLIVSAVNTHIDRGDIVISTQPNAFDEPIVKRVIAKGGQTVDINFETGDVYVDNVLQSEPYIAEKTKTSEGINFPIIVPEGKLFLMGDNRNDSTDSRSPDIGCVDERYILGVVRYRLLPEITKLK